MSEIDAPSREAARASGVEEQLALSRALQSVALALSSELDRDRLVQKITDEARAICGAAFGAFFHNVERDDGGSYLLYTLSGAPREAFERFGQPRATPVFAPTFRGEGPVRSDDIRADPRYGKWAPHHGMPRGHLPVVSYLAVPVVTASGEVLGGLFFGHPEPGRFTHAHEQAVSAIAAHAAIALDNARLFARLRANEAKLGRSERRFRSLVEATSEMVWSTNALGEVVDDSLSWRSFTGQSLEAWRGYGWLDAVHPDDRPRAEAAWREAVERKGRYEVDYRVRRADGTYAHTIARGAPILDANGEVEQWIGMNFDVTARVLAEKKLSENERRLELALEAGRMGTWEHDVPTGTVRWSPGIERIHGIAVGSFEGTFEAYLRDIHPLDKPAVIAAVERDLASGKDHHLCYRIVRPDGELRWIERHGSVERDGSGRAVRLSGVCADVTDRVAADEAKNALRLQRVLEGISDSFRLYDRGLTILFANEASAANLGVRPAELVGKKLWEVAPGVVGTRFHSDLVRVLETGQASTFEEYYAPLDRWFEVHAYPVAEVGVASYSRDVTVRRREQALRDRIARYGELRADVSEALALHGDVAEVLQACCEAMVARLGVAFARVWLLDQAGETLELRASAGKYTHTDGAHARVKVGSFKIGLIAEERQPHLTNDVLDDPRVSDRAWAAREGMQAFAGYPLVVSDRLVGVMAAFATQPLPDDTLSALANVADALAQGIERRRAEIALEDRARDLARSNAELEQFAYVASHDLQEPLRMVASYVQLLERRYKDKLDDDARDFIGFAVEGATRMRRLIDDLLVYSRVGTQAREPVEVDLGAVLSVVMKNLERARAEAGAEITCDPLPSVVAVEAQMVQLFQNLVGNAIKFRSETPPKIHVGARREGGAWQLSVSDNGIGIDPQYFERIFVIFQRLNPRERYPGTGIGLAITKKIVERHGGRIWVESAPGRGSTIHFTLPVQRQTRSIAP